MGDELATGGVTRNSKHQVHELAKQVCRELRNRQTNAEDIFWQAVRNRRFHGKKFTRQFPYFFYQGYDYTFYVIDFLCHELKLAVELDGSSHDNKSEEDAEKTKIIEASGIRLVRFRNKEVENNLTRVLERLRRYL
ncbi:MAG: endonuclease domain-containing protein [Bacteroidota bacterium]